MSMEQSAATRMAEFQTELRAQLPKARRALDAFQSDPKNWEALDIVRTFFHRIAGVAKPLGAPVVGALAMQAEDTIVLLSSGKAEVSPISLRIIAHGLNGVEAFLAESPAPSVASPQPRAYPPPSKEILIIDDDA